MNKKGTPFGIFILASSLSLPIHAQYVGDQLAGAAGLQAGSQPPPGYYMTMPLFFRETSVSIYDAQGNRLLKNATANINMLVVPVIEVITSWKILGAYYGVGITQFISNGNLTAAALNFHRSTSIEYGDLYVQPVILGWHAAHVDVTTGYSFFAPTGLGSASHQMWVNEFDFGTTLFPDKAKNWNISTMSYLDFNGTKTDQNVKVGDILTLTGGAGRSFRKQQFNVGVAYGAQWKVTHDSGPDIPPLLPITDGRIFGVGPEADVQVFLKGLDLGMLSVRYLWPVGPKTSVSGRIFAASFTIGHLIPK